MGGIDEQNGGSCIAMMGKDCVCIGSDLRLGNRNMTVATDYDKVTPVTEKLYIGWTGLQTDALTLREKLRFRVYMYKMKEQREITPEAFASLVSSTLYEKRFGSYYAAPVIAGIDSKGKPIICTSDTIGCLSFPDDVVSTGTAQDKLLGVAEGLWQPDLSPDELFEICSQTLLSAMDRDALSGWGAIVRVITKDTIRTVVLKGRMD